MQLVLPTRVELVYRPYRDRVLTIRLRKYMVAPAGLEPVIGRLKVSYPHLLDEGVIIKRHGLIAFARDAFPVP